MTQPKPHQALFIACVGLFGSSFELRRAGKRLQLGEEMDEVEHVDWLSIIGLSPWAEAGNERLNSILRQRQLFDDRQVSIDLRWSEFARSLGMPEPEGHVQDNYCSGKNELKPHFRSLLEFVPLCRNQSCCKTSDSSKQNA
ncbi:MAG: hypothetical protein DMF05_12740 [Verrucomicrobia bacterium]|nr:MAG: hypothetical protein DMF05_12740 [Verrucomicrobiota bacterium]